MTWILSGATPATGAAIPVYVVNQVDLTATNNLLTSILSSVQNIDTNTSTVDALLNQIITDLNASSTLNHNDLLQVIAELQILDANTDNIELQLTQLISNTSNNATAANQTIGNASLSSIDTKLNSQATAAKQDTGNTSLNSIDGKLVNPKSSTATVTQVTATTTVLTLAAANANRKKIILFNDSNQRCYIKFGSGATTTDFTISIGQNQGWEEENYNGIITAITNATTANIKITEI